MTEEDNSSSNKKNGIYLSPKVLDYSGSEANPESPILALMALDNQNCGGKLSSGDTGKISNLF